MMKAYNDKELIASNSQLEEKLTAARSEWSEKVSALVEDLKNNEKLTETMAYGLAYRQMIIEDMAKYKQALYKRQSKYERDRASRYTQYMVDSDLKFNATERGEQTTADLTALKYQMNLLQTHIDYLADTVNVLSSLQFAIKNKITILTEEIM